MTDEELRAVVATAVGRSHGNVEFLEQIRRGEQDDGPFMVGAFAARDAMMLQVVVADEVEDEPDGRAMQDVEHG